MVLPTFNFNFITRSIRTIRHYLRRPSRISATGCVAAMSVIASAGKNAIVKSVTVDV